MLALLSISTTSRAQLPSSGAGPFQTIPARVGVEFRLRQGQEARKVRLQPLVDQRQQVAASARAENRVGAKHAAGGRFFVEPFGGALAEPGRRDAARRGVVLPGVEEF